MASEAKAEVPTTAAVDLSSFKVRTRNPEL